MADCELIGFPQSSFTWTARIALEEMGVPYRLVPAAPHTPEVEACNPSGRVPAFRHGDLRFGESRAIIGYAERALGGKSLLPADPAKAAVTEQWVSVIMTAMDPVFIRQYLFAYLFPKTADKSPDRAAIDAAVPKMNAQLDRLEAAIKAGEIGGPTFTLADAYLVPVMFYANSFPEGKAAIDAHPAVAAWLADRMARPSVQATLPPRT
jgi:glutathione S-transferase